MAEALNTQLSIAQDELSAIKAERDAIRAELDTLKMTAAKAASAVVELADKAGVSATDKVAGCKQMSKTERDRAQLRATIEAAEAQLAALG